MALHRLSSMFLLEEGRVPQDMRFFQFINLSFFYMNFKKKSPARVILNGT